MQPQRRRILAAAAAALLAGCAHAPAVSAAAAAGPPAADEAPASAVVTGSRLPQRVDPVTGKVIPVAAVRTYDRADLDRTGRPGLGAQLPAAMATQP